MHINNETRLLNALKGLNQDDRAIVLKLAESMVLSYMRFKDGGTDGVGWMCDFRHYQREMPTPKDVAEVIKFPKKKVRKKKVVNSSAGAGGQVIGLCDGRGMAH